MRSELAPAAPWQPVAFIPPTPSPCKTLLESAPLLDAIAPILHHRITCPQRPTWMDDETETYLRNLTDSEVAALEERPHDPPATVEDASPFLRHLHALSAPLRAAFPYLNHGDGDGYGDGIGSGDTRLVGKSARRSKGRPRVAKRVQIRAVRSVVQQVLARTSVPVSRVLDFGAGHAHLSAHLADALHPLRVMAVERDAELVRTAMALHMPRARGLAVTSRIPPRNLEENNREKMMESGLCVVRADAVADDAGGGGGGDVLAVSRRDAIVGLHACGCLGDAVLQKGVRGNASAIVLVSCCLQKIGAHAIARTPLSVTGNSCPLLRTHLTVSRTLLGATNSARGYGRKPGDRTARETRYAIRRLLADAGKPVANVGDEVYGISRHVLRRGLLSPEVLQRVCAVWGIGEDDGVSLQADDVARRVMDAERDFRVMRALALPRGFAAAMLEVAVVLERAAFLEEAGFSVATFRIWPDDCTSREGFNGFKHSLCLQMGEKEKKDKRQHLSYEEKVCHVYACAIQKCLRRNNYDENKCKKTIQQWKDCLTDASQQLDQRLQQQRQQQQSQEE